MPREATHFRKGKPRPAGAGRRPGSPNKTTSLLKHAILAAAGEVGFPVYNKKTKQHTFGSGGLQGFLEWAALKETKGFLTLLGRVLPLQLTGDGGGPIRTIDETTAPALAAQLYAEALKASPPPMIDITPQELPVKASLPRVIPRRNSSKEGREE